MPGTPKPWINAIVRAGLAVPGLRGYFGRVFTVITVTGAKTGKRYSVPVAYRTVAGRHFVFSQTKRRWWRNVRTNPDVELLIDGKTVRGSATLASGEEAYPLVKKHLEESPRVAKYYRIPTDPDGKVAPEHVRQLLELLIMIDIQPSQS
jgi:deazaflavin-dependent oxidoreductase (nitroreductase family)